MNGITVLFINLILNWFCNAKNEFTLQPRIDFNNGNYLETIII